MKLIDSKNSRTTRNAILFTDRLWRIGEAFIEHEELRLKRILGGLQQYESPAGQGDIIFIARKK
ncbi:MAG: hypothetical protein J5U16_02630, partial [Candidatus Methanoperedens sp.]|nr:hypothetical protein [Candidatus Methanoperedens sp.]